MSATTNTYKCQMCGDTVAVTNQPTHVMDECGKLGTDTSEIDIIGTREWNCDTDDHVWVGGMMYVHNEDADTVNAERLANGLDPLECERCEVEFPGVAE